MSHVRWMIRRDMPEVMEIEQLQMDSPFTEDEIIHRLRKRNAIGIVAEIRDTVCGYAVYLLHKTRIEIVRFAVHPSCLRQRIGSDMIEKLIGKLSHNRRSKITIDVPYANFEFCHFLRSHGFKIRDTSGEHYRFEYLAEVRHEA